MSDAPKSDDLKKDQIAFMRLVLAGVLCWAAGVMCERWLSETVPDQAFWPILFTIFTFLGLILYSAYPGKEKFEENANRSIYGVLIILGTIFVLSGIERWIYAPTYEELLYTQFLEWATLTDPNRKILDPGKNSFFRFGMDFPLPNSSGPARPSHKTTLNLILRKDYTVIVWTKRTYSGYDKYLESLPIEDRNNRWSELSDLIFELSTQNIEVRASPPATSLLAINIRAHRDASELTSLSAFSNLTGDVYGAYLRIVNLMERQQREDQK